LSAAVSPASLTVIFGSASVVPAPVEAVPRPALLTARSWTVTASASLNPVNSWVSAVLMVVLVPLTVA